MDRFIILFYRLDLGLRKNPDLPSIGGEAWQVHGGILSDPKIPRGAGSTAEHLTWFKWESYATWLSGFALLAIVYYAGADIFLIDPTVAELSKGQAICISLLSIGLGWLIYDQLCKSVLGQDSTRLMVVLYLFWLPWLGGIRRFLLAVRHLYIWGRLQRR